MPSPHPVAPAAGPASPTRWSRLAGPVAGAGLAGGSLAVVGLVDPHVPGRYPACPSLTLFGVLCPLCGGLRGVHALTEGDLVGMVSSNLLLPLVLVLGGWAWLSWALAAAGRPVLRPPTPGRRTWLVIGTVALAYTVLRNLAGTPFEVLAP